MRRRSSSKTGYAEWGFGSREPLPAENGIDEQRLRLIGLGERSFQKSYFPELKKRLVELERFRALLDRASDLIFLVDGEDGRIEDANVSALARLGRTQAGLRRMRLSDFSELDMATCLAGEAPADRRLETVFTTAAGERFPVEVSASSMLVAGERQCVLVARDITERKAAEDKLHLSLREKETLLKEIHHRVKNNLQVVSSLLHLQMNELRECAGMEALRESAARISTMALVHEQIYRSPNLASINLGDYLEKLLVRLVRGFAGQCSVAHEVRVPALGLDVEKAVPLGLIVNEAVTNALKHGMAGREAGRIDIFAEETAEGAVIEVRDDGPGFPPGIDLPSGRTLGIQLINGLARQLDGNVTFVNTPGATVRLGFPLEKA